MWSQRRGPCCEAITQEASAAHHPSPPTLSRRDRPRATT
jgi:hypothetical protein